MECAADRTTVLRSLATDLWNTEQTRPLFTCTSYRFMECAADRTTVLGALATDLWSALQTGPLFYVHKLQIY
jgi:hypothetical protein